MPARKKPVSARHSSSCWNEPALNAPAQVQGKLDAAMQQAERKREAAE